MADEPFSRSFIHPETGGAVSLSAAVCDDAWHGKHHTAQIAWVCEREGWSTAP
jgi:hypothetical protein